MKSFNLVYNKLPSDEWCTFNHQIKITQHPVQSSGAFPTSANSEFILDYLIKGDTLIILNPKGSKVYYSKSDIKK